MQEIPGGWRACRVCKMEGSRGHVVAIFGGRTCDLGCRPGCLCVVIGSNNLPVWPRNCHYMCEQCACSVGL